MTTTISATEAAEQVFREAPFPNLSINHNGAGSFSANSFWPNGDVGCGVFCMGSGPTIEVALSKLAEKWATAEAAGKKLRTAAECKAAVIDLIREHDAAPASFRDAVDALPIA